MWGTSAPDSIGAKEEDPNPAEDKQELIDLKEQFEQQQLLITQLKDMLKKSDQVVVAQEKMEEYANTLSRISARTKQGKQRRSEESDGKSTHSQTKSLADTPAKEKIMLLKQQMEENKAKMAQRGKFHKNIEETVSQLKAHLDDSQQLMKQAPTSFSKSEASLENFSSNSGSEELYNLLLFKEKQIQELKSKVQRLETHNVDLLDTLKEKDSVIDAKTKAITLMSESLSKKGKQTLDTLDDTKEEMRQMQENFVKIEEDMKTEKRRLLSENQRLMETCNVLEKARDELRNETFVHLEKIEALNVLLEKSKTDLESANSKIKELEENSTDSQQKGSPSFTKGKKGRRNQKSKDSDHEKLTQKIQELEKLLQDSQSENANLTQKISDLNIALQESTAVIEELKAKSNNEKPKEEINELKKQIDTNNKNMVKIKAQHKSKLKELNKQIEAFKKISDVHAEVLKLQAENTKLKETVNTEQEKIETKTTSEESSKVASQLLSIQYEEQLEKLEIEKKKAIEEKEQVLSERVELEEKITELTKEKQELTNKLENYMHENMELIDKLEKLSAEKVSSAESIEIVENLTQQEKLELEAYHQSLDYVPEQVESMDKNLETNPELNESVNQLTEETSDLLRKIELFTEERREVMEKLENLTLENNNLNVKIKEIENNRDLLVETYEQLQNEKETIETELQEVIHQKNSLMSRISELEQENSNLKSDSTTKETIVEHKLEENNEKQVLSDQIDEYKSLIQIQSQEIKELKTELLSQKDLSLANREVHEKLTEIESKYESLLGENEDLKKNIKENTMLVQEKDSRESELILLQKRVKELEEKLSASIEEIENYKGIIEENNQQLIDSSQIINDYGNKLSKYETETTNLNSLIADLNSALSQMQSESQENCEINEEMSNQLKEVKDTLNENLKQMNVYQAELQSKSDLISDLEKNIDELKSILSDTERELSIKNRELHEVIADRDNKESIMTNLQSQLKQKDELFYAEINNLKQKCLSAQTQIEQNTDSLDTIQKPLLLQIQQLESKNKEQMEKMKKIAANLKKKTNEYHNLEAQYNQEKEKWMNESSEEEEIIVKLQNDLILMNHEYEKLRLENETLNNLKQDYENQLHSYAREAEITRSNESNTLNTEINEKNVIISNLEELNNNLTTINNANQIKIQQLEMVIENQEADIVKYRERINRLEEGLSNVEERRMSLEKKVVDLGAELTEKSANFEEAAKSEDILEQRLTALMAHDELIEKQLQEITDENRNLTQSLKTCNNENSELKHKISTVTEKLLSLGENEEKLNLLEVENLQLIEKLKKLESKCKHLQEDHEFKLKEKDIELTNMESMLQEQVEILNDERRSLTTKIQQLEDEVYKLKNTEAVLNEEINSCKEKMDQQQVEYEKKMIEYEKLEQEHKKNLMLLDQQNMVVNSGEQVEKVRAAFFNFKDNTDADNLKEKTDAETQIDSSSNQEELLNKIKGLELMLYNVEKDKEEINLQCHHLTEEISKLIYENQNAPKTSDVETQICTETDVTEQERKTLHELEFTASKPSQSTSKVPIHEDAIEPKEAYLCYKQETPSTSEKSTKQEGNAEAIDENDDGWGWGPEEAKLEEDYRLKLEENPLHLSLKQHVEQMEIKIRAMEIEREQHLEELRAAQVKSGKLIKKLKELKGENDRLKQNVCNDLDNAIQEELKMQIANLEQKIKVLSNDFDKEKNEKLKLLSKCENLQAVNESMLSSKEKYESELLSWQKQNKELSDKLNQFEWGGDGFDSPKRSQHLETGPKNPDVEHLERKIEELNETIKELTLDNEELQAILEEQRNLRSKTKSTENQDLLREKLVLQEKVASLEQQTDESQQELNRVNDEKGYLQKLIGQNNFTIQELSNEILSLKNHSNDINANVVAEMNQQREILKQEMSKLQQEIEQLHKENQKLLADNTLLNDIKDDFMQEKSNLLIVQQDQHVSIETLHNELVTLKSEMQQNQQLLQEIDGLKQQLLIKDEEFNAKLTLTTEQLIQEWTEKVDQRGADVAESWKLHLDQRENEFMQLEQLLRREINAMEEKCNLLLNENNELRLNADNEIKNEVDRITTLQKTISDKEQSLNELNETVRKYQMEIEEMSKKLLEIDDKNERISKLEEQLLNLQQEHTDTTKELHNLELDCKSKEDMINSLTTEIATINQSVNMLQETIQEKDSSIHELTSNLQIISNENSSCTVLQQQIIEYQQTVQKLTNDLAGKQFLQEMLDAKEAELIQLQTEVYHLNNMLKEQHQEMTKQLDDNEGIFDEKAQELSKMNEKMKTIQEEHEQKMNEKDSAIENLQYELNERLNDHAVKVQLNQELEDKIKELQAAINEQNVLHDDENKQLSELKQIIEDQVLKIESLKQELFAKSNDYDSLIAEFDIRKKRMDETKEHLKEIETHQDLKQPEMKWSTEETVAEDDCLEPVSRAELDLALYMLHQRDVRCEELTVELMQLLEERDTLQLKLSNSLREKEEIKKQFNITSTPTIKSDKEDTVDVSIDEKEAVNVTSASEEQTPLPNTDSLTTKLSELKSVGYGRDKTLLDEKQQRRYQQLSLMQQHRDVGALLPPEAAAKLVHDANLTLSRDVQSPSKVLLNWLWGNSTPKVNDV